MHWYIAPVIDCSEHGTHPAMQKYGQDPSCGGFVLGTVVHAYTASTCLVGSQQPQNIAGWTALTLQEAKDHFAAHYGQQPSEAEVY